MRKPDVIVGSENDPQLLRWHLWLPPYFRRRGWQLALHRWVRSDKERELHDHTGNSVSILLTGGYWEVTSRSWHQMWKTPKWWRIFSIVYREAEFAHRIEIRRPIWTLWLRGPPRREWGFHCRKGWVHWRDYLNGRRQ